MHQGNLFAGPVAMREAPAPSRQPDPADAFATRHARRVAFDAWVAAGRRWPPPAGLTSACASACMPNPARYQPMRFR